MQDVGPSRYEAYAEAYRALMPGQEVPSEQAFNELSEDTQSAIIAELLQRIADENEAIYREGSREAREVQGALPSPARQTVQEQPLLNMSREDWLNNIGSYPGPLDPEEVPGPVDTPYQTGGYVGRGTMAGELGRRGDLSVRQAGETMFERMKRLRGYAHGGYTGGYHMPRGTVAGELPRYGDMSVREEGESMGELAKRHRDQDWYNRMGRGLGSLHRNRIV